MNKLSRRLYPCVSCGQRFRWTKTLKDFDKIVILDYINAARENISKRPINYGRKMTLLKLELVEETTEEKDKATSPETTGTEERSSTTGVDSAATGNKANKKDSDVETSPSNTKEEEKKSFFASILSSLVDRLSKMAAKAAIEDVNISTYVGLFLNRVEKKLKEMLENGEQITAPMSAVYSWGAGKAEDVGGIALAITPREKCNKVGAGDATGINIYEGLIGINLRNLAEFLMHSPKNRAFLLATVAIIDDLVDSDFPNVLIWKIEGCVPNEENLKLSTTYDFHGYSTRSFKKASNKIKETTFEEFQQKINDFKEYMKEKGKEKYELTDYRYREKVLITVSKKKAADIFLRTITKAIELIANALPQKIEEINKKFNEREKIIKMVVHLKSTEETETPEASQASKSDEEPSEFIFKVRSGEKAYKAPNTKNREEEFTESINLKGINYKSLNKILLVEEAAKSSLQTLILESLDNFNWDSLKVFLNEVKTDLVNLKTKK